MGHVPAHRWADPAVDARRRAAMERHADACAACGKARQRVRSTMAAFDEIRAEPAPALNWEHIGARIYWVTSSERRAATREMKAVGAGRLRWKVAGAGAALAAAAGVFVLLGGGGGGDAEPTPAAVASEVPASTEGSLMPVELTDAPAVPLIGIVTFAQGELEVDGEAVSAVEALSRRLARGDSVRTGPGARLTIQLGDMTGFTLGPSSSLELRSLDDRNVELGLDGEVSVEVSHRRDEQRFAVVAGDRVVSVHGTLFRVEHVGGALEVECSDGRVTVESGGATVAVDAGMMLRLVGSERLSARRPAPLTQAARDVLEREVSVRLLPAFPGPQAVFDTSAVLRLAGTGDNVVAIDGEPLGTGEFAVRVMPGRHLISGDGRHGEGEWVRLDAGQIADHHLSPESPAVDPGAAKRARRGDLDEVLSKGARVRPCLRQLEKQGLLPGSFVVLDIGVNASGTLSHLNVVGGNLPSSMSACVQSVVDSVRLPSGQRARVRYRIEF